LKEQLTSYVSPAVVHLTLLIPLVFIGVTDVWRGTPNSMMKETNKMNFDWLKPQWNMFWFGVLFLMVCWTATVLGNMQYEPGPDCDNSQYSAQSC
jgi:hypothetical protein